MDERLHNLYTDRKAFDELEWCDYSWPMELLYNAQTIDEFHTYLNDEHVHAYFKNMPGLWGREEIFMTWYDKMDMEKQAILKALIVHVYNSSEDRIFVLSRSYARK